MKSCSALSLSTPVLRLAILTALGLAAAAQAQIFYPLADIGSISSNAFNSTAYGVSGNGIAVGFRTDSGGSGSSAFHSTGPGFSGINAIGDLGGGPIAASALGISSDGSTFVGYRTDATGQRAFYYNGGTVDMGLRTDGTFSRANAVNATGSVIVGAANGTGSSAIGEAFSWTSSTYTPLGSLAGAGQASEARSVSGNGATVVGWSDSTNGFAAFTEAFRWTSGGGMVGLGDLAGGSDWSQANDISADGTVIVGFGNSASGQEAFRWTSGGGMVGLGDLAGGIFSSVAHAASGDGSVVVGRADDANGSQAFYWTSGTGMIPLAALLGSAVPAGWTLTEALAVSDDGLTFAGVGLNPFGGTEAWVATVPEPSSVGLAVIGAIGLGAFALRRRNRA